MKLQVGSNITCLRQNTLLPHLRVSQLSFGSIFNLCPDTLDLCVEVKLQLQLMISMIIFISTL